MRKLLFVVLMLCGSLYGQVIQYGKITDYDKQTGGAATPLSGVFLTIATEHDCQPTTSDSKGLFRLCFNDHHIGDVVRDITARKPGYEVVNIHVTRSWTLTTADTAQMSVVTCRSQRKSSSTVGMEKYIVGMICIVAPTAIVE